MSIPQLGTSGAVGCWTCSVCGMLVYSGQIHAHPNPPQPNVFLVLERVAVALEKIAAKLEKENE